MNIMNVEIKARCRNPGRIRTILKKEEADFRGTDHQIDTYFTVKEGRLKLREGDIENNLIYYRRSDRRGPETSEIRLVSVDRPAPLKTLLADALGVMVTVDKQREIYFIGNVKFHIDRVKELGDFVEIEAIDRHGVRDESRLSEQCVYYLELFSVREKDLIEFSYSDMLLNEG